MDVETRRAYVRIRLAKAQDDMVTARDDIPEFGAIFSRARRARERHDYDLDVAWPSSDEAEQIVSDAERFIARVERYLHEVGATD
jgi:uncharacterized protein (UPF0332 family)